MEDQWRKDSDDIFERFAAGLDDSISTGEKLKCADRDLQFALKLQNDRVRKNNLKIKYDLKPRGLMDKGFIIPQKSQDGHYINSIEVRSCEKDETIFSDGKKIFHRKNRVDLHQTLTNITSPKDVENDDYMCPDCGTSSKISTLIEGGCPSCGNKFKISELYPKISNYYFLMDVSSSKKELWKTAIPSILISIAAHYIPCLIYGLLSILLASVFSKNPYEAMQNVSTGIGALIFGFIYAIFMGAIVGWMVTSLIYLVRFGAFAADRIPFTKYLGTQKKFEEFMKSVSPEFSYEFFAGKTVSLVKMALLSDDPTELPFYNAEPPAPFFKKLIDSESRGVVGVVDSKTEGDYAIVTSDVFLENTYFQDGKIIRKNDKLRVVMKRNVNKPIDINFKITAFHCPTCGGSFDATKNKICPYCGNAYKMEDTDWSIVYLQMAEK